MIGHVRRARKEHTCAYGTDRILPGETYCDETYTPWDYLVDDVDDEGRSIGSRANSWSHVRFHPRCLWEERLG